VTFHLKKNHFNFENQALPMRCALIKRVRSGVLIAVILQSMVARKLKGTQQMVVLMDRVMCAMCSLRNFFKKEKVQHSFALHEFFGLPHINLIEISEFLY